jgi:predicted transcriptional regulator
MVLPMRHEEVDVAFCSPQRRLLLLLFMEPSERVSRVSLLLHCATIEAISHTFAQRNR